MLYYTLHLYVICYSVILYLEKCRNQIKSNQIKLSLWLLEVYKPRQTSLARAYHEWLAEKVVPILAGKSYHCKEFIHVG